MTSEADRDLQELVRGEPVRVNFDDFSTPAAQCVRAILHLAGAREPMSEAAVASVVTFERLRMLSKSKLETLREEARSAPVLVCPGTAAPVALDERALDALTQLAGTELESRDPARASRFTFGRTEALRPFVGMTFREAVTRTLSAVDLASGAIEPLVTTDRGAVFLKVGSANVYLTLVPFPDAPDHGLFRNELTPERFMGLVPLLFFLRLALGERMWLQSSIGATFMVDDPNLRFARYGFLNVRRLVEVAHEHCFHASIAMIPLDYRKSRASVAGIFRGNPDVLSLVLHGVDHLRGEFAADVPLDVAESTINQGLLRMEAHERATGIQHARALTFPHGLCNAIWMEAMRNVGLEAAIVSRSFPFRLESEIPDPLYELHPAETGFRGFPVINRFPAERQKEALLFHAFVGKPLIVYTHHAFFQDGFNGVLQIAEFLNRQVAPRWGSIETILRSNYQVKHVHGGIAIRAFSNRISIRSGRDGPARVVFKRGLDFPADEACWLDSMVMEPIRTVEGVGVVIPPERGHGLEVSFGPGRGCAPRGTISRPPLKSRSRRFATELRDQAVMPVLARLGAAHRLTRRFR